MPGPLFRFGRPPAHGLQVVQNDVALRLVPSILSVTVERVGRSARVLPEPRPSLVPFELRPPRERRSSSLCSLGIPLDLRLQRNRCARKNESGYQDDDVAPPR